jgi:hypothetical protein
MPGDPNECRKYAHRCTELAAETTDTDLKNRFTDLAAKWTQLAIDLEDARARNRSAISKAENVEAASPIEPLLTAQDTFTTK